MVDDRLDRNYRRIVVLSSYLANSLYPFVCVVVIVSLYLLLAPYSDVPFLFLVDDCRDIWKPAQECYMNANGKMRAKQKSVS